MKKNWHYWMCQSALKDEFGSLLPDFPIYHLIIKKEFNDRMAGQTIHKLNKKELNELKRLAQR